MTDGSIFIGGEREFKRFNIRDGLGLVLARRAGLKIGWVSARPSPATKMRADELKIHFLVQQGDRLSKTGAIEELLAREKLSWNDVCFVGDDIVDLGPLKRAGFSVAVGRRRGRGEGGGGFCHARGGRARRGARGGGNDFAGAGKMGFVRRRIIRNENEIEQRRFHFVCFSGVGILSRFARSKTPRATASDFTSVEYFEPPHQQQMKSRMSGAEAQPQPGGLLVIKQLKLETFDMDGKPESVAEAPDCVYDTMNGMANSPGHLQMRSGDGKFRIEGDGFLWRRNNQSLTISNRVQTVIETAPSNKTEL